jgi:MATE family multidrug resistance protein
MQTAVTALVGRYIGRGQPDVARRRAHLAFSLTLVYIVICWTIFVLARRPLMELFTSDPRVIAIGSTYLICAAIYELFDAMYIIYSGALRGAGDTLAPMVAMAILCWTISIGGGYVMVLWMPRFYSGPWIAGCVYGAVLGIYMVRRFLRGHWREIRLAGVVGVGRTSGVAALTTTQAGT